MYDPLLSIILPVYNGQQFLETTLESILSQSFKNYEIIAIDDGSTDKSIDILNQYSEKDWRIKVFSQSNHGICATRNRGIHLAKSKYIMFCDHDDKYLPGYIERAIEIITNNNVDFAKFGCKELYIDKDRITKEHVISPKTKIYQGNNVREFLLQYINDNEYIWDGIYTKTILEKIKGFDEKYKYGCEDLALMLDLAESANSCICDSTVYYVHNIRNAFSTSRKYHDNSYWDVIETWKRRFNILAPEQYPDYEQSKLKMLIWAMCGMFSFQNCDLNEDQMEERFRAIYNEGYKLKNIHISNTTDKKKILIYILYKYRSFSILAKICAFKRKKRL